MKKVFDFFKKHKITTIISIVVLLAAVSLTAVTIALWSSGEDEEKVYTIPTNPAEKYLEYYAMTPNAASETGYDYYPLTKVPSALKDEVVGYAVARYDGFATEVEIPSVVTAKITGIAGNTTLPVLHILRNYSTQVSNGFVGGTVKSVILPETITYVEEDALEGLNVYIKGDHTYTYEDLSVNGNVVIINNVDGNVIDTLVKKDSYYYSTFSYEKYAVSSRKINYVSKEPSIKIGESTHNYTAVNELSKIFVEDNNGTLTYENESLRKNNTIYTLSNDDLFGHSSSYMIYDTKDKVYSRNIVLTGSTVITIGDLNATISEGGKYLVTYDGSKIIYEKVKYFVGDDELYLDFDCNSYERYTATVTTSEKGLTVTKDRLGVTYDKVLSTDKAAGTFILTYTPEVVYTDGGNVTNYSVLDSYYYISKAFETTKEYSIEVEEALNNITVFTPSGLDEDNILGTTTNYNLGFILPNNDCKYYADFGKGLVELVNYNNVYYANVDASGKARVLGLRDDKVVYESILFEYHLTNVYDLTVTSGELVVEISDLDTDLNEFNIILPTLLDNPVVTINARYYDADNQLVDDSEDITPTITNGILNVNSSQFTNTILANATIASNEYRFVRYQISVGDYIIYSYTAEELIALDFYQKEYRLAYIDRDYIDTDVLFDMTLFNEVNCTINRSENTLNITKKMYSYSSNNEDYLLMSRNYGNTLYEEYYRMVEANGIYVVSKNTNNTSIITSSVISASAGDVIYYSEAGYKAERYSVYSTDGGYMGDMAYSNGSAYISLPAFYTSYGYQVKDNSGNIVATYDSLGGYPVDHGLVAGEVEDYGLFYLTVGSRRIDLTPTIYNGIYQGYFTDYEKQYITLYDSENLTINRVKLEANGNYKVYVNVAGISVDPAKGWINNYFYFEKATSVNTFNLSLDLSDATNMNFSIISKDISNIQESDYIITSKKSTNKIYANGILLSEIDENYYVGIINTSGLLTITNNEEVVNTSDLYLVSGTYRIHYNLSENTLECERVEGPKQYYISIDGSPFEELVLNTLNNNYEEFVLPNASIPANAIITVKENNVVFSKTVEECGITPGLYSKLYFAVDNQRRKENNYKVFISVDANTTDLLDSKLVTLHYGELSKAYYVSGNELPKFSEVFTNDNYLQFSGWYADSVFTTLANEIVDGGNYYAYVIDNNAGISIASKYDVIVGGNNVTVISKELKNSEVSFTVDTSNNIKVYLGATELKANEGVYSFTYNDSVVGSTIRVIDVNELITITLKSSVEDKKVTYEKGTYITLPKTGITGFRYYYDTKTGIVYTDKDGRLISPNMITEDITLTAFSSDQYYVIVNEFDKNGNILNTSYNPQLTAANALFKAQFTRYDNLHYDSIEALMTTNGYPVKFEINEYLHNYSFMMPEANVIINVTYKDNIITNTTAIDEVVYVFVPTSNDPNVKIDDGNKVVNMTKVEDSKQIYPNYTAYYATISNNKFIVEANGGKSYVYTYSSDNNLYIIENLGLENEVCYLSGWVEPTQTANVFTFDKAFDKIHPIFGEISVNNLNNEVTILAAVSSVDNNYQYAAFEVSYLEGSSKISFIIEYKADGTTANPILIDCGATFNSFVGNIKYRNLSGLVFKQTKDIIVDDVNGYNMVYNQEKPFKHIYEGNNKKLTYIQSELRDEFNNGIFGYIVGERNGDEWINGIVRNLTLDYSLTDQNSTYGYETKYYLGSVASVNYGLIENVKTLDYLIEGHNVRYAGGIAGLNVGKISNCVNNIDITLFNYGVAESRILGGITGYNGGTIINTTNNGEVKMPEKTGREEYIGGIAGLNKGPIINSVSTTKEYEILEEETYLGVHIRVNDVIYPLTYHTVSNDLITYISAELDLKSGDVITFYNGEEQVGVTSPEWTGGLPLQHSTANNYGSYDEITVTGANATVRLDAYFKTYSNGSYGVYFESSEQYAIKINDTTTILLNRNNDSEYLVTDLELKSGDKITFYDYKRDSQVSLKPYQDGSGNHTEDLWEAGLPLKLSNHNNFGGHDYVEVTGNYSGKYTIYFKDRGDWNYSIWVGTSKSYKVTVTTGGVIRDYPVEVHYNNDQIYSYVEFKAADISLSKDSVIKFYDGSNQVGITLTASSWQAGLALQEQSYDQTYNSYKELKYTSSHETSVHVYFKVCHNGQYQVYVERDDYSLKITRVDGTVEIIPMSVNKHSDLLEYMLTDVEVYQGDKVSVLCGTHEQPLTTLSGSYTTADAGGKSITFNTKNGNFNFYYVPENAKLHIGGNNILESKYLYVSLVEDWYFVDEIIDTANGKYYFESAMYVEYFDSLGNSLGNMIYNNAQTRNEYGMKTVIVDLLDNTSTIQISRVMLISSHDTGEGSYYYSYDEGRFAKIGQAHTSYPDLTYQTGKISVAGKSELFIYVTSSSQRYATNENDGNEVAVLTSNKDVVSYVDVIYTEGKELEEFRILYYDNKSTSENTADDKLLAVRSYVKGEQIQFLADANRMVVESITEGTGTRRITEFVPDIQYSTVDFAPKNTIYSVGNPSDYTLSINDITQGMFIDTLDSDRVMSVSVTLKAGDKVKITNNYKLLQFSYDFNSTPNVTFNNGIMSVEIGGVYDIYYSIESGLLTVTEAITYELVVGSKVYKMYVNPSPQQPNEVMAIGVNIKQNDIVKVRRTGDTNFITSFALSTNPIDQDAVSVVDGGMKFNKAMKFDFFLSIMENGVNIYLTSDYAYSASYPDVHKYSYKTVDEAIVVNPALESELTLKLNNTTNNSLRIYYLNALGEVITCDEAVDEVINRYAIIHNVLYNSGEKLSTIPLVEGAMKLKIVQVITINDIEYEVNEVVVNAIYPDKTITLVTPYYGYYDASYSSNVDDVEGIYFQNDDFENTAIEARIDYKLNDGRTGSIPMELVEGVFYLPFDVLISLNPTSISFSYIVEGQARAYTVEVDLAYVIGNTLYFNDVLEHEQYSIYDKVSVYVDNTLADWGEYFILSDGIYYEMNVAKDASEEINGYTLYVAYVLGHDYQVTTTPNYSKVFKSKVFNSNVVMLNSIDGGFEFTDNNAFVDTYTYNYYLQSTTSGLLPEVGLVENNGVFFGFFDLAEEATYYVVKEPLSTTPLSNEIHSSAGKHVIIVSGLVTNYTYTFVEKQLDKKNPSKELDGLYWTLDGTYPDDGYWAKNDAKGQQFGSSNSPYSSMTLTSETVSNVSEIVINTSGADGINATLTVTVGGVQIGEAVSLTAEATDYLFTSSTPLNGEVVLSYTQTSSKAIYLKTISINPTPAELATAVAHRNEITYTVVTSYSGSRDYNSYKLGQAVIAPLDLPDTKNTKYSFEFIGWYCNGVVYTAQNGYLYDENGVQLFVKSDMLLTPAYKETINKVMVTLVDGEFETIVEYDYGVKISSSDLADATNSPTTGAWFVGWYIDDTKIFKLNKYPITKEVNIYSKWHVPGIFLVGIIEGFEDWDYQYEGREAIEVESNDNSYELTDIYLEVNDYVKLRNFKAKNNIDNWLKWENPSKFTSTGGENGTPGSLFDICYPDGAAEGRNDGNLWIQKAGYYSFYIRKGEVYIDVDYKEYSVFYSIDKNDVPDGAQSNENWRFNLPYDGNDYFAIYSEEDKVLDNSVVVNSPTLVQNRNGVKYVLKGWYNRPNNGERITQITKDMLEYRNSITLYPGFVKAGFYLVDDITGEETFIEPSSTTLERSALPKYSAGKTLTIHFYNGSVNTENGVSTLSSAYERGYIEFVGTAKVSSENPYQIKFIDEGMYDIYVDENGKLHVDQYHEIIYKFSDRIDPSLNDYSQIVISGVTYIQKYGSDLAIVQNTKITNESGVIVKFENWMKENEYFISEQVVTNNDTYYPQFVIFDQMPGANFTFDGASLSDEGALWNMAMIELDEPVSLKGAQNVIIEIRFYTGNNELWFRPAAVDQNGIIYDAFGRNITPEDANQFRWGYWYDIVKGSYRENPKLDWYSNPWGGWTPSWDENVPPKFYIELPLGFLFARFDANGKAMVVQDSVEPSLDIIIDNNYFANNSYYLDPNTKQLKSIGIHITGKTNVDITIGSIYLRMDDNNVVQIANPRDYSLIDQSGKHKAYAFYCDGRTNQNGQYILPSKFDLTLFEVVEN